MSKKVKFGFKNVYYAKVTSTGYSTPVHIQGAVSISLSKSGDDVDFYADDNTYFHESVNNGYEGTLELALVPDTFKTDILGFTLDSNGVLVEDATASQNSFALLCEFTNDGGAERFAFLNCAASRPELTSTTKSSSKEIQTETLDIVMRPNSDGKVKYSTTEDVDQTVYNNWYTQVYTGGTTSI